MNMKKFLIAGIIVVLIPLLGIPVVWKTWSLIIIGLYIVYQALVFNKKDKNKKQIKEKSEYNQVFVENYKNEE